jgi:hypothetical protein
LQLTAHHTPKLFTGKWLPAYALLFINCMFGVQLIFFIKQCQGKNKDSIGVADNTIVLKPHGTHGKFAALT